MPKEVLSRGAKSFVVITAQQLSQIRCISKITKVALPQKKKSLLICKLNFKQRTEEKKEKIGLENALGDTYNKLWFIASAIASFAHLKILCVSGVFFVGSFVVGFGLCWAIIGLGRLWFASMTFSHFGYWLVRRATRRPKGKRCIQSPKYR